MQFTINQDEYWWGGCIVGSEKMPFDRTTVFSIDLLNERRTQTAPLFLSNQGRYLWSEDPFEISFDHGTITIPAQYDVELRETGQTLREAYLDAMHRHFPFEKNIHTPREFYQYPQFNTWMELIKNENQKDILQYANEVVANGYHPGILMIDGGWQKCQGTWEFDPEKFDDPKEMVRQLHALGFIVMIWVSPFMCAEGTNFLRLYSTRSSESTGEKRSYNHLVRNETGDVAINHWWSGYSAILNFNLPDDCAYMDEQLGRLMNEYGIDGFKFDGGSYCPNGFVNCDSVYGGYDFPELNRAWIHYGAKYRYHEYKDTWKMGGQPVVQRLWDKNHAWTGNGLNCLIPNGVFAGLIGCPFICPDMVGGGEWTAFVYGKHDEELFIRMAQCSALFPMMQFSSLPWRHLSARGVKACQQMAELHERMFPEIDAILTQTEQNGEPMIRNLEYQYPNQGYAAIQDEFLLGENILVAPVLTKGSVRRTVVFPKGSWQDEDGQIFTGAASIEVDAPLEKLLWFRRMNNSITPEK